MGLAAAALLARGGVRCTVLECRSTSSCGQSRAVTVQGDILSLYDRIGVADEIRADGASWSLGRTYYGDHEIAQLHWPATETAAYPPFVNFPQFRIEELLHSQVSGLPEVEIRLGVTASLAGPGTDADPAVVHYEEADGTPHELRPRYVIAADGVRSATRKSLGVEFAGWRTNGRFLVCDFRAVLPFSAERRLWFSPPFYPEGIVLMHNIGKDTWRLDWQVPPELDPEEEHRSGRVSTRIADVLEHAGVGPLSIEVLRCNGYTFQQRCAQRFRIGRTFLVGDAAHVVSPFGARGMNSGMEDVENLAWKLTQVLDGRAGDGLLESYESERMAAATHHVSITGESMQFMTPDTAEGLAERNEVLAGAVTDRSQADRVNSGKLYEPFPYRDSPLTTPSNADTASGVVPGDLLPDPLVATSVGATPLRHLVSGRFTLVHVPAAPGTNLRFTDPAEPHLDVHPAAGLTHEVDAGPEIRTGTDRVHLVRPDCYVAATFDGTDDWPGMVAGALRQAMGAPSKPSMDERFEEPAV